MFDPAGFFFFFLLSVGLPVANALDVLQPCGLLYYPWCSNSHHQSSSKRSWQLLFLDVPTFTTSRLPRDPSSQRWKYVGEKWPMNFSWNARLPRSIQESFTCRKSTTWDRRLYIPSEGRRAEDFFAQKNPTASAGFEPANLDTKGQHATSRPPKPLPSRLTSDINVQCYGAVVFSFRKYIKTKYRTYVLVFFLHLSCFILWTPVSANDSVPILESVVEGRAISLCTSLDFSCIEIQGCW